MMKTDRVVRIDPDEIVTICQLTIMIPVKHVKEVTMMGTKPKRKGVKRPVGKAKPKKGSARKAVLSAVDAA